MAPRASRPLLGWEVFYCFGADVAADCSKIQASEDLNDDPINAESFVEFGDDAAAAVCERRPDSAERDKFFMSLTDISNRRKEAWVATALFYMNHPLRQKSFIKLLPASLDMLQEVQRTGDVFFPQNWLSAIFGNHQTKQAWQAVESFLKTHPDYNPKLKAKILQSTDNLYRAQQVQVD